MRNTNKLLKEYLMVMAVTAIVGGLFFREEWLYAAQRVLDLF